MSETSGDGGGSEAPGRALDVATVTPAMRRLFVVAGGLVVMVGTSLFFFSTETDRYFAWTIATPLTAAFLGAG